MKPNPALFLELGCLLLLCTNTEMSAQTFGNVAMGGGGYVTGGISCSAQQNLCYAKRDVGGAYRWEESTQSWVALLDWCSQDETTYQGVESLAIDPQAPEELYILAGTWYWNDGKTAALCSTNYGNTFAITDVTSKFKPDGNDSDRQKGEGLAVDPNNATIVFCGTRGNAGPIEADKNVHGRVYISSAGRGVVYMDSSMPVTGLAVSPNGISTFVTATQQLAQLVHYCWLRCHESGGHLT